MDHSSKMDLNTKNSSKLKDEPKYTKWTIMYENGPEYKKWTEIQKWIKNQKYLLIIQNVAFGFFHYCGFFHQFLYYKN